VRVKLSSREAQVDQPAPDRLVGIRLGDPARDFRPTVALKMSIEDTIGYRQNVPACAVCGKNVQGGGGFARVNQNGHLIEICCPLCLETFENDPDPYLRRLERIDYFRYLSELETPAT